MNEQRTSGRPGFPGQQGNAAANLEQEEYQYNRAKGMEGQGIVEPAVPERDQRARESAQGTGDPEEEMERAAGIKGHASDANALGLRTGRGQQGRSQ
jgi:hypothetical protein